MSEVHLHLHIPAGYQLAFIDGRMTISPIASAVRESARSPLLAQLKCNATFETGENGVLTIRSRKRSKPRA